MHPLRIAVVGAGTAGLAAAAFLRRYGHEITIIERFAAPQPVGAGLLLQPTGLACLARLGLDSAAARLGHRIDSIHGATDEGRPVLDLHYRDLAPHLFGLGIHRGSLFSLLYGEVLRLGVPVTASTDVISSDVRPGGRVLMTGDGRRLGPFELVIDASGLRSVLRSELGATRRDRPYAYGALWGVAAMGPDWSGWHVLAQRYRTARVMMGVLPIGRLPDGHEGERGELAAVFWSLKSADHGAWLAAGIDAWRMEAMALWPEAAPLLEQFRTTDDLVPATYADVALSRAHGERLAVIGDAAHATSPQLGQGANLGLVDALTLAECLSEGETLEAALAAYTEARRAHTRFYQLASRWLTPFFQSDSDAVARARDLTFGPLCRLPVVRGEMLKVLAGVKTGLFSSLDPGLWHSSYGRRGIASRVAAA